MESIDLSSIYLRASVAKICNLNCVYCAKQSGMEDRAPAAIKHRQVTIDEYIECLESISQKGIRRVSYTGGEPTTNPDLPEIIERGSKFFEIQELTSNGFRLTEMLPKISTHLDLIKISMDTTNEEKFPALAGAKKSSIDLAKSAILELARIKFPAAVNCVLMKSNRSEVFKIIDFVREVNDFHGSKLYVSVLDFYFSKEKREIWEREYVSLDHLESELTARYPDWNEEERYGCRFVWINCDGVWVRMKDSGSVTMRGEVCQGCPHYCQEGLYGLKLSRSGWVTTCPTNDIAFGGDLHTETSQGLQSGVLGSELSKLTSAKQDSKSFEKMLLAHQLTSG